MLIEKRITVVWLLAAVAVLGAQGLTNGQPARESPTPQVRGTLKAVDAAAATITVSVVEARQAISDKTYSVAKDVEVGLSDGGGRRGVLKESKLADLAPGVSLVITLAADQKTVTTIVAEGTAVRGVLK